MICYLIEHYFDWKLVVSVDIVVVGILVVGYYIVVDYIEVVGDMVAVVVVGIPVVVVVAVADVVAVVVARLFANWGVLKVVLFDLFG